jgi:hypothetical protein
MEWPAWWHYEIALSPHALERMEERHLTEIDLRGMLEDASGSRPAIVPGRFIVVTMLNRESWEIVVEPDELAKALIVVTAYRVES